MSRFQKLFLLFCFVLPGVNDYAQDHGRLSMAAYDSLISEVKKLTKYDSGLPVVFIKLENYCWDIRMAKWDSIYKSRGGEIIRYPDSPALKYAICDSVSLNEKLVFNMLLEIKNHSTGDVLVDIAEKHSSEIAMYCFLLLCIDDNPASRKILEHYLTDTSEIWVEECGNRKRQRVRDFMLDRMFSCFTYDGRTPMITVAEFKGYVKIAKGYKPPFDLNQN